MNRRNNNLHESPKERDASYRLTPHSYRAYDYRAVLFVRRSWGNRMVAMARSRFRALLALATLTAALTPAVAGASAIPREGGAPSAKPVDVVQEGKPDEEPRAVTAAALDTRLRQATSDLFAGLELGANSEEPAITVHAVDDGSDRTDAAIDSVVDELGEQGLSRSQITVEPAMVTLGALNSRRDMLTVNVDALRDRGTRMVYWAASVTTNTLEVGVEQLDARARADIVDVVGSDALTLREVRPNADASRTTDSSPWYGGDLLSPTPTGGSCTSGFSVRDGSGITYNTTAGHCGNGTFKQDWQGYGVTVSMNHCNLCNGDDQTVSSYPGSSAGWVFTSSTGATKVGFYALASYAGDIICTDGYFTGEPAEFEWT